MQRKKISKNILLIAIASTLFASCAKKDDGTISSDRNKYLGTWHASSNGSTSGPLTWDMTITAGNSSSTQIKMENFHAIGASLFIFADVESNTISFPFSVTNIVGNDTIFGNGNYNSNGTLSFTYADDDGQNRDNVTATAHK